jgi:thiamine biosynthesis protein ThiI
LAIQTDAIRFIKKIFTPFIQNINVITLNSQFVNYELLLIRYGEIALKAKKTRKRFENTLVNNIVNALKTKNLQHEIIKEWGRIYVYTDQIKKSIDVLKKIFGIYSISPVLQTSSKINEISKIAVSISKQKLDSSKSFAIRATRTGEHDYTSQDVAVQIGNDIVKQTKAKVNLTNPDFELFIEIRNNMAYLFIEKIKCYGGMPVGTQGNILSFVDSPKSILASWYLIHRGCKPIFISSDEIKKTVIDKFLNNWFIKSKIFVASKSNNLYEQIKKTATGNNCEAIVTGYTLYNDSDFSIENIKKLKNKLDLPILHPLIAMDEIEINRKLRELGLQK